MRWGGTLALSLLLSLCASSIRAQTVNCEIPYQFSFLAFTAVAVCIDSSYSPLYHQNGGGSCSGHILCFGDQNMDIKADHIGVQSTDASLSTSGTISGSPTAGDMPGINITLNSVSYQLRYIAQPGDTATTVAAAIANCIGSTQNGNTWIANTQAHCTISPATFTADLLALGYITRPNSSGTGFNLDMPWGLTTAFTAVSSGTTTVAISQAPPTASVDNGPYFYASRLIVGRTPTINDAIGWYRGDGQSGANSGVDTQYAGLKIRIGTVSSSAPEGIPSLEGATGGNLGSIPLFSCIGSRGCWVEDGVGSNPNQSNTSNSRGGLGLQGLLLQNTASTGQITTLQSTGASGWFGIGTTSKQMLAGWDGSASFVQSGDTNPIKIEQHGGSLGMLQIASLVLGTSTTALQLDGSGHLLVSSASTKDVVLSPGGGAVTLKVTPIDAIFGQGTPLATTATAGFFFINSMAGTPTGAPASWATGVIPIVVDTINSKICWNQTGAGNGWKCAAGS
jgi:hypothetical protein